MGGIIIGNFLGSRISDNPLLAVDAIGVRFGGCLLDALSALVPGGLRGGVDVGVAEGGQILVGGVDGKRDVGIFLTDLVQGGGVFASGEVDKVHCSESSRGMS